MMTHKILFSLFLCGIIMPLNAQFANVAIYSLPDSTLILGTTTDQEGAFLLLADNKCSNALLRVSFNTAIHDENKAFFAEYSRSAPIGQITAGVRFENVHSNYYSDDVKMEEQSRHYARWFPNFSYSNTLGGVQMQ
ncbi:MULTISPECIES: outer membrane beta-barrel protein [unclassified Proteiniphilum]|uniref:outer membrane beta-barrel protein n=1 Tax=unclassified Proteiniphilum TaxID=2622718 RepID=UPI0025804E69|nr:MULTISPECIES: outer membrane beta-barrel protein [unclassified Proteiniphilum]